MEVSSASGIQPLYSPFLHSLARTSSSIFMLAVHFSQGLALLYRISKRRGTVSMDLKSTTKSKKDGAAIRKG